MIDYIKYQFNRLFLEMNAEKFFAIMEGIITNPFSGVIVVDAEGRVVLINETYREIIGLKKEEILGHPITEITPHTRMLEVMKTEEYIPADRWVVNGTEMIVARMPIYKGKMVIGAIGKTICTGINEAKLLQEELNRVERELKFYRDEVRQIYRALYTFNDIIGDNAALNRVKLLASQAAHTTSTVLITGESGTGKEIFAQAIHNGGCLRGQPFVRINCAAIPENLLEAELFGYEEGAFTGANKKGKPGKFELANEGTIFLDEIGDMPLTMQTKLLTVLQERVIERVGGTRQIPINVRVIAATHRNLEELLQEHRFREDLYYRLNVIILHIPPLRERMDDLPALARHLTVRINNRLRTQIECISEPALDLLSRHHWPGNVRELENIIERAINLADMNHEQQIYLHHLPALSHHRPGKGVGLNQAVNNLEKELISLTLEQTGGNKLQTARILGIHSSVLYRKIKKYEIE